MNSLKMTPLAVCLALAFLTGWCVPSRGASSFTTLTVDSNAGAGGQHMSSALVSGNPGLAYRDNAGHLRFARGIDANGTAFFAPITVDGAANVGESCSLQIVNGNPAISYYDRTNGDVKYVRALDVFGAGWGTPVVAYGTGNVGLYTSLAVVNGNPAIAFFDSTNSALKFVRSNDVNGTAWGAPVTISAAAGFYVSMQVLPNGLPAVAFGDTALGKLFFAQANNADGTSWAARVAVDSGTNNTGIDIISLQSINNNPAIAYHDSTSTKLKYARATDANGASFSSVTAVIVDNTVGSGYAVSLRVVNSVPAIAYQFVNQTTGIGAVKYVEASDVGKNGATWGTPITVDSTSDVGLYVSMLILSGGNPGIGYYDATNLKPKFAYAPFSGVNYTWNGGSGTWASGTTGWSAGNWADGNNAIIGKGNDTAGTITVSSNTTINPAAITFSATGSGSYTLAVNGTVTGGTFSLAAGATIRGTGSLNRTTQTGSTGVIWPGAALVGSAVPSIGESLTLSGLDMSGGGKLKIALARTSSASTQKLIVTGSTCVLGGTLSLGYPAGNGSANVYTVVSSTANAITGTFSTVLLNGNTVTGNNPVNVQYTAGAVTVTITGSATPVTLDSFAAKVEAPGVLLNWNCVSEFQNGGFNVYRRALEQTEWVKANPALIAGRITNPDEMKYAYFDWAPAGMYEYKLESVDLSGGREFYGKLSELVKVDWMSEFANANDNPAGVVEAAARRIDMDVCTQTAQRIEALFTAQGVKKTSAAVREFEMPSTSVAAPVACNATAQTPGVGVRWFSNNKVTDSPFASTKVVYSKPGVMIIPQASMPNGYDLNNVSMQREGRNFSALAKVPGGLLVYVPGYQDDYTDRDALFLRKSTAETNVVGTQASSGLFNSSAPVNVVSPAMVSNSYHDVYFNFSSENWPYSFTPWFSNKYLIQGVTQNFVINLPQTAVGAAKLTLNLWSLTSDAASPDHSLQLVVNGQIVGDASWDGGNKKMQLSFEVPSGVMVSGDNTVSLVTPTLAEVNSQLCFVHSISVNYTRLLDGSKSFEIVNNSGKTQLYELNNVPSTGAWVVDTRFPDRASLVASDTQVQADGTLRLRFMAGAGGSGKFVVTPIGQENAPISITSRQIKAAKLTGTYLATGPLQFSSGVQPLLTKRSKEGIRGTYLDQEQLFDYYNFGRYGPDGIRNAVRSLKPTYLLLVGRTVYDYLNYEGKNIDPLCPAYLVSTTYWAQTTSDSLFGDLGRGYPEVAVGRLPVNNTSELSGAVNHILNYKGFPESGVRAQLTALQADPAAGDFAVQADTVAQTHPEIAWQKNYLGITSQTDVEIATAMRAAANGGADLLIYVGHGSARVLGDNLTGTTVLHKLDQPESSSVLGWQGNVPFLQCTCTSNWMANNVQDYRSIAIQALTQPQGGISANVGTSTYMNSEYAVSFMNNLLKNTKARGMRWGTALMLSQQWALKQDAAGLFGDLGRTEQLFGDPAMPVYSPKAPATSSSASPNAAGAF